MKRNAQAFTLIEIMAASLAASILLLGVYSIFHRAMKSRDAAVGAVRQSRIRQRAVSIIRTDLASAYISGGLLASTLEGGMDNQKSKFPGYLRFTTSTGKDTNDDQGYGDTQQIEYYISGSAAGSTAQNGPLVRVVTRDLLSGSGGATSTSGSSYEETVLPGVEQMEVTFYDGSDWQYTWQVTGTTSAGGSTTLMNYGYADASGSATLPRAIRVRLMQSATSEATLPPPPVEVLVPFETEPFVVATSSSASASGSSSATPTPTVTPTPTPAPTAAPTAVPTKH